MLEAHANTNETSLWMRIIWILLSEVPRMLAQNEREPGNANSSLQSHNSKRSGGGGTQLTEKQAASKPKFISASYLQIPGTNSTLRGNPQRMSPPRFSLGFLGVHRFGFTIGYSKNSWRRNR